MEREENTLGKDRVWWIFHSRIFFVVFFLLSILGRRKTNTFENVCLWDRVRNVKKNTLIIVCESKWEPSDQVQQQNVSRGDGKQKKRRWHEGPGVGRKCLLKWVVFAERRQKFIYLFNIEMCALFVYLFCFLGRFVCKRVYVCIFHACW